MNTGEQARRESSLHHQAAEPGLRSEFRIKVQRIVIPGDLGVEPNVLFGQVKRPLGLLADGKGHGWGSWFGQISQPNIEI
jgi:hypothetical protein